MKFFALDKLSIIALAMTASLTVPAQEKKLPAPAFTGGMPMNEVVAARRSVREFDSSREMIPRSDSSYGCQWVSTVLRPPLLHLVLHPAVAIPRLGTGRKSGRLCSAKTVCGNIGRYRTRSFSSRRATTARWWPGRSRFPRTSLWMHPARLCLLRI